MAEKPKGSLALAFLLLMLAIFVKCGQSEHVGKALNALKSISK